MIAATRIRILYYVAYEASVDAGIDFSKVSFTDVKNEDGTHVFTAHIPEDVPYGAAGRGGKYGVYLPR